MCGPRAYTTGKKTGAQFSINAPRRHAGAVGIIWEAQFPIHAIFRFTFLQQEVLAFLGFRCQGVPGGVAKAMPPRINWLKVPFSLRRPSDQSPDCNPMPTRNGIVTHQVLIAFTDAHRNHHRSDNVPSVIPVTVPTSRPRKAQVYRYLTNRLPALQQ